MVIFFPGDRYGGQKFERDELRCIFDHGSYHAVRSVKYDGGEHDGCRDT